MSIAALAAPGIPAHAAGVTVTLPQGPIALPQTGVTVTAPGAHVGVGPGGAQVEIDPQKTVEGVTGGGGSAPGSPPPAGQPSQTAPSQQAGLVAGGEPPARSAPGAPVSAAPRSGQGRAGRTPSSTRVAASSRAEGAASRPASGTAGSAGTTGARGSGSAPARSNARADRAEPSAVRQIIEKIPGELLAALLATALLAAAMSLVWLRERGRVRAAQRKAELDPLTGIPNRLAFEERITHEWKRACRYGRPLGLMLLDLDGLKRVNDRDGHEAGDEMIKTAATLISDNVRASDLAARLAGDEFVVVCPETPTAGLSQMAQKLGLRLQESGLAASIGWAELSETDVAPGDLLARADASMYQEKARRRTAAPVPTARADLAIAS